MGAWVLIANIQGIQGIQGPPGASWVLAALANGTNLDTWDTSGINPIVGFTAANSMTPTKPPVLATGNYTHAKTGTNNALQRWDTTGKPFQTWERRKDGGVWNHFRRMDPAEPLSLMHLSRSAGTIYFENATNGHVRFPFRVGTTLESVVVNIENKDDRTNTAYTGAVTITSVWFGVAEIVNGEMTGKYSGTPTQILTSFTLPTDGTKYTSIEIPRTTFKFDPHVSYLISFGYTTDGANYHRSIGGCWRGAFSSEAGSTNPSTLTQGKFAPFTTWLNVRAKAPRFAMLGDSHTTANNALFPVYQSPINLFALANGGIPINIGHGGSQLADWRSVAQYKYQKYQISLAAEDSIRALGQTAVRADGLIIEGGQNDLYNGAVSLATLKDNFIVTANACRSVFGPNIWGATMMPRNGSNQTPAQDADRIAFNDWLRTLPSQIVGVVDFAAAIADPANPSAIDPRYVDPVDLTHLTTAGCWRLAEAIPSGFGRNVTF